MTISFASDNCSGIHPAILQAIIDANHGHQHSYGDDDYTKKLHALIHTHFGDHTHAYPVLNGTGANVIALQALSPRHGVVICSETAHIYHDESNAPQYVAGLRLLTTPSDDGKLSPQAIRDICHANIGNVHAPQPTTVYISQVTELGTCYTLDEIRQIVTTAKEFGLYTYIDGARLANACAYLDCTLKDIADTGVDILTLGGTKNGLMIGECIVVFNQDLHTQLPYLRKNTLHLASKMRFISAQFVAWLDNGLWRQLAQHSNYMAQYLAKQLYSIDNIHITQPVQSNAVFATMSPQLIEELHKHFHFYDWHAQTGKVRFVMSFDTQKEHIDELVYHIRQWHNTIPKA